MISKHDSPIIYVGLVIIIVLAIRLINISNFEEVLTPIEVSTNVDTEESKKTFVTIGDSITSRDRQQYGGMDAPHKGYQQHISEELDLGYINLGISGSTVARGTEYKRGLSKLVIDFNLGDPEFMIIEAGTNDFTLDVPLGESSEITSDKPDRTNFYGGYTGMLTDIIKNNPNVDIYLFTPTIRDCTEFEGTCVNKAGNYLEQYRDAIIEVGEHFGVNIVDMYTIGDITPDNLAEYMIDSNLHPNDKGYELMARKFLEEYDNIRAENIK